MYVNTLTKNWRFYITNVTNFAGMKPNGLMFLVMAQKSTTIAIRQIMWPIQLPCHTHWRGCSRCLYSDQGSNCVCRELLCIGAVCEVITQHTMISTLHTHQHSHCHERLYFPNTFTLISRVSFIRLCKTYFWSLHLTHCINQSYEFVIIKLIYTSRSFS